MVFLLSASADAQTLGGSVRQLAPGTWKLIGYYQGVQDQDLRFTLQSGGPCSAGGSLNPSFACGSGGNVDATGSGGALKAMLLAQPWEGLQYYVSAGVGRFSLSVPSNTVTNVLTGDLPGYLYNVGVRAVIIPDTVAGPGVAIDGSLGWQRYYFSEMRPSGVGPTTQVQQRLDVYQYQVALVAAHRFDFTGSRWFLEPYGGIKWVRSESKLKDLRGGGRVGGIGDTFTPVLGLQLPVYERELLFAEATFVGGYQYAAGLQVRFK